MTYTFFISTTTSLTYQVYPLNWLECTLIDEKERDQVFYRRKFEGSLTFGGKKLCADFNLFYDFEVADPCQTLYLYIFKDGDSYWEGYFSTSMGDWDLDNQTFTVTPIVIDDYSLWDDEGDIEYNILALTRVNTIYDDGGTSTTYDRTILMADVIEYLAQQIYPALSWAGGTIQSTFLTNATNPVTLATNRYNYLTISQKSDIVNPTSTNPATIGMMSFNGLMEILKCINLRWSYDVDFGILTIEHVSFWSTSPTIDIRGEELARRTNKYVYLNEETPKYEKFAWMEAGSADFIGLPIWYQSTCVSQDPETNTSELSLKVTTDIEYIRACVDASEQNKISNEGWVLFATELRVTDYYILFNAGIINAVPYFNADLSWSRLHNNFFKHERQLLEGYMNGALTTFYSAKKIKQQECSIKYCTTFDPNINITTELGETWFSGEKGDVKRAVIKPYGEINLTLIYGPEGGAIVPVPDLKSIRITEDTICGQLHAVLSEPADDNLDIYLGYEILDIDGNFVCGEAAVNLWTIPLGALSADYTLLFDDPACGGGIPAGGCWNPVTNFLDPESKGWTVYAIIQKTDCSC